VIMRNASVLAVILNWNGIEHTLRCAEHVLALTGAQADLLIVDNGSEDDSLARLRDARLPARVVALETNEGFAGGMNAGLRDAIDHSYQYVWLLNSDAFVEPRCLQSLVERMDRDPTLAMVTPRLLSSDGTEQHAGGTIDWNTGDVTWLKSSELVNASGNHYLTGTAPLLRVANVVACGLFEPAFFAYWEDADLCVRLRRAGGRLAAVPDATALHLGSASSGTGSPFAHFLYTRNTWLFLERNARAGSDRVRWWRFASAVTLRAANYDLGGTAPLVRATLAGLSAARRRQYGPPTFQIEPAMLERWTFKRPWGWSRILQNLADWVEPLDKQELKSSN
jgi:GT2 family glycosyltransferase